MALTIPYIVARRWTRRHQTTLRSATTMSMGGLSHSDDTEDMSTAATTTPKCALFLLPTHEHQSIIVTMLAVGYFPVSRSCLGQGLSSLTYAQPRSGCQETVWWCGATCFRIYSECFSERAYVTSPPLPLSSACRHRMQNVSKMSNWSSYYIGIMNTSYLANLFVGALRANSAIN